METLQLNNDITAMGFQVNTFPDLIGEAFDSLIEKIPDGRTRSCYGISYCINDQTIYFAAIDEKEDETAKYGYERYIIPRGIYSITVVRDRLSKTEMIKDAFHALQPDTCPTKDKPAIEWYRNDKEMVCMIPL